MRTGPSRVAVATRADPVASADFAMSTLSLLVPFRPAPGTMCNCEANMARKVLERDKKRVGHIPFRSVPFRPAQATLCNHKANKGREGVRERDEEEDQKPKYLAELTLVLPF